MYVEEARLRAHFTSQSCCLGKTRKLKLQKTGIENGERAEKAEKQ